MKFVQLTGPIICLSCGSRLTEGDPGSLLSGPADGPNLDCSTCGPFALAVTRMQDRASSRRVEVYPGDQMDESAKPSEPMRSGSAAHRHRLDSGSAARPMNTVGVGEQGDGYRNSIDGPRADSNMAGQELTKTARGVDGFGARCEHLGFGAAIDILQRGGRVARSGWNGKGQFLALQVPDFNSKMSLPYIYIRTVQGDLVPWLASQTDILANDWCIVREEKVLVYGSGAER